MQPKTLTPDLAVFAQIGPADVGELARLGFRSIICNRPDGEASDQPPFADIAAAADDCGLATRFLPVVSGQLTEGDVAAFGAALHALPKPVAAYCRTGTRCAMLWALANPDHLGAEERLRRAKAQGYDLSALQARLEKTRP